MEHRLLEMSVKKIQARKPEQPKKEMGRGTKARIETAAERIMFNSKQSD